MRVRHKCRWILPLFHPGLNLIAVHGIDNYPPYRHVGEEINFTIAHGVLPGDADEHGSVGFDDLLTVAQHYSQTSGAAGSKAISIRTEWSTSMTCCCWSRTTA